MFCVHVHGRWREMGRVAQYAPVPESIRAARLMVGESLRPGDDADLAAVLTAELSSNAVDHAATPFTVAVGHEKGGALIVEVHDDDPTLPVMVPAGPESPRGRGLVLVDAFSQDWGVEMTHEDGKRVWFRLAPLDD